MSIIIVGTMVLSSGCSNHEEAVKTITEIEASSTEIVVESEVEDIVLIELENPRVEGLFYSDEEGIYYIEPSTLQVNQLYAAGPETSWDIIETTEGPKLYFNKEGTLYQGNLMGEVPNIAILEDIWSWHTLMDPVTGTTWIAYETDHGGGIITEEGTWEMSLTDEMISGIFVREEMIYFTHYNDVQNGVYRVAPNKEIEVLIKVSDFYHPTTPSVADEVFIDVRIEGIEGQKMYFVVADYSRYIGQFYEYDLVTGGVQLLYEITSDFSPNLWAVFDTYYIQLGFMAYRHYPVFVQLSRESEAVVMEGERIGSDEVATYILTDTAISSLEHGTNEVTLLTTLYPMDWYTDYKEHWVTLAGDWIYFNDYDTAYSEEERMSAKDKGYRMHKKTGEVECIESDKRNWSIRLAPNTDDKGHYYGYTYSYDLDTEITTYEIVRISDQVERLMTLEERYRSYLTYFK